MKQPLSNETRMLIKPKDFYQKNPNFNFPVDHDDPEIHTLRAYVLQEQVSNPIERVKTKWKVPFSKKDGTLTPLSSARRWARKDPNYVEIENHCFFTAIQFEGLGGSASNPFICVDDKQFYMFDHNLESCISYPYFFEHGWLIGRFVYIKKGSEVGIRPFNPKKDKILPGNPLSIPQGVTP